MYLGHRASVCKWAHRIFECEEGMDDEIRRANDLRRLAEGFLRPWFEGDYEKVNASMVKDLVEDAYLHIDMWKSAADRLREHAWKVGHTVRPSASYFDDVAQEASRTSTGRNRVVVMLARAIRHERDDLIHRSMARYAEFFDVRKLAMVEIPKTVPFVVRGWIRKTLHINLPPVRPDIPDYVAAQLRLFICHVSRVLATAPGDAFMDDIPDKQFVIDVAGAVRSVESWLRVDEDILWRELNTVRESIDYSKISFRFESLDRSKIRFF